MSLATEFTSLLRTVGRWSLLGSCVGLLAGLSSAIFLISLDWATRTRLAYPSILYLLPLAGLALGWLYWRYAGTAAQGNNLVIEEIHSNAARIPQRMAPLILLGTVITHLFGGSAGREGTALQMAASLADGLRELIRLDRRERRLLIMAGVSGGFGAVFGTPFAGLLFGLEVQSIGQMRYEGLLPCLVAAYVGDLVVRGLGVSHAHYPPLANVEIAPLLLGKVALAGLICGLVSMLFIELTHAIKAQMSRWVAWPPLRPLLGGVMVAACTLAVGNRDYLGLSLPLIQQSLGNGQAGEVATFAFLGKLLFTTLTLGTGFLGGEVTPLFVIGATLGHTLGGLLGVDPAFMAAIGFVAVFAGASNTPLACTLMGIELFGGGSPSYLLLGCVMAYLVSGHRSIYTTQRIAIPKSHQVNSQPGESLQRLAERMKDKLPSSFITRWRKRGRAALLPSPFDGEGPGVRQDEG